MEKESYTTCLASAAIAVTGMSAARARTHLGGKVWLEVYLMM